MAFGRRDDGQASVTYAGVLALIAGVFVGVFSLGLDQRLQRVVEGAVCTITGGANCAAPDGTTNGRDDYQDSGEADREIYDADCTEDLPGDEIRSGNDAPSGDPEADAAYENLGRVYDYYRRTFGRDSFDNDGATLVASINVCETPGERWYNAKWNGSQMEFGEGFAAPLDVTAHELTHAITDRTADLIYECQSGALNESFSDVFASNIDTGDWEIGEDVDGGPLRDMADPGRFGDPAHVDDYDNRVNDPDDRSSDHGGVHTNSAIPNHAYYLMVQKIGRSDAEQIVYKTLTERLKPDSGFEDYRTAALQVAREMFGADSSEYAGINDAFAEVGLDGHWVAPEQEGC